MTISISSGFSKIMGTIFVAGFLGVNSIGLYFIKEGLQAELRSCSKDIFTEEWTEKIKPLLDLEMSTLKVADNTHSQSIAKLWEVSSERTNAMNKLAVDVSEIKGMLGAQR